MHEEKRGDHRVVAFDGFYRDEFRAVAGLVFSLCRDWRVAEEIAQDSFAEAFKRWSIVARHPDPRLWVRRTAINRCNSMFRRRHAEQRAYRRVAATTVVAPEGDLTVLLDMIHDLPKRQATAFALVHVTQHSASEAATVMGCSESTLRTHLERARQTLKQAIREANEEATA